MTLYKTHMIEAWLRPSKNVWITFLIVLLSGTAFSQKVIDKVVAQVGEEIILLSDIQAARLQEIQSGLDGDKFSDCMILEELMYEKLLVNQAKIDSIEVSDDMVNQEMEARLREIARQIGSMEALEEFYGKSVAQIKADFFMLIKKKIQAERMRETITQDVVITPKEVKEFYNKLPKDSIPYINSKVVVAQIVKYPAVTQKDKEKSRKILEGYRSQIVEGKKTFATIASLYSDDPGSRLQNGELGWQTRGTMVPEFEAALFKLEKMEVSPVFETQYGYHIVQLLDRRGDNYSVRHVLITPKVSENALMKAATTMDSIYTELKKGRLKFEDAAQRFSDDENSKQNGGKIVNPYSGDYYWDLQNINEIDPQMSRVVDILKIGGYSSPALYDNMYEQKQGIRIVKLLDKTKPHLANLEEDRQLIELAATNEKKQEVIDKWIQGKINGTFITIDENYLKDCDFKYNWKKTGI